MQAITIEQASFGMPRYLAALEHGESFIITKGKTAIGKLIPFSKADDDDSGLPGHGRPKVGEIVDRTVVVSDDAFAPLTDEELKEWGL